MTFNTYQKGDDIALNLGESARKRLICGLRWDPMTDNSIGGVAARGASGVTNAFDLDLICLMFSKDGVFLGGVSGTEGEHVADNGNIYHTGDVVEGEDDHDDEQIIMELFNLSSKVHHIFLIAEVQSAHNFGQVENPEIRLVGAMSEDNIMHQHLGTMGGENASAFVLGRVNRDNGRWSMEYIGDYKDLDDVRDWSDELLPYLGLDSAAIEQVKKISKIEKGDRAELKYSKEARQRVLCGLSWDPLQDDPELMEKLKNLGRNVESYDLDLACMVFDENGEIVDGVSANPEENMDQSGHIYHSGDSTDGDGANDDETISLELKNLPDYVHHVIFVAEIQSMHTFSDVLNPAIRIADGKTDNSQLSVSMSRPDKGVANGYVFARIYREGSGWALHYIDEFFVGTDVPDLVSFVKQYIV